MTPSDSPGSKIGVRWKQHAIIFHSKQVSQFCPKICCHGNRGHQWRHLHDTVG